MFPTKNCGLYYVCFTKHFRVAFLQNATKLFRPFFLPISNICHSFSCFIHFFMILFEFRTFHPRNLKSDSYYHHAATPHSPTLPHIPGRRRIHPLPMRSVGNRTNRPHNFSRPPTIRTSPSNHRWQCLQRHDGSSFRSRRALHMFNMHIQSR